MSQGPVAERESGSGVPVEERISALSWWLGKGREGFDAGSLFCTLSWPSHVVLNQLLAESHEINVPLWFSPLLKTEFLLQMVLVQDAQLTVGF